VSNKDTIIEALTIQLKIEREGNLALVKRMEDAVAAEREACAKVCETFYNHEAKDCAEAIRARGIDAAKVGEVGTWGDKREWVGLTDEEVQEAGRYSYVRGGTSERLYHIMWNSQPSASIGWCREELIAFAQTIEARIKDKNT
jgi:hypothetical protein